MHEHECRRCYVGVPCTAPDDPITGCDAFTGYCPQCEADTTLDAIDLDPVRRVRVDPYEAHKSLAKAQKIAARTAKRGLEGGYKVWLEETTDDQGTTWQELCWEGEPPRFGGWTFVAVVEWLEDGQPMTRVMPGYEGPVVDRERASDRLCDHCGTRRQRNALVVVESATEGRKFVGSTCVKDYLGWTFHPTFLPEDGDFEEIGGGSTPITYLTHSILLQSAMMARGFGWHPRSLPGYATADRVATLLSGTGKTYESLKAEMKAIDLHIEDQDEAAVADALVWLDEQTGESEYIYNLRATVTQDHIGWRSLGLAASLVPVAMKSRARDAEKRAEAKAENLTEAIYAEPKTRVTITVKVTGISDWSSDYGVQHMHTFVGEGHRFQWKTGSIRLEEGETYTLTGTVKGEHEYKGRIYTQLLRCKIQD